MYGRIFCDYRRKINEKNRTSLTVGGDRINYPYDSDTPTADLFTVKLIFNSVISVDNRNSLCWIFKKNISTPPLKLVNYLKLKLDSFQAYVIL